MAIRIRKKRLSRSTGGDVLIFFFLGLGAAFMAMPMVYTISQAFKPLNELWLFPPQFFVRNPTLDNFNDLLVLMVNPGCQLPDTFLTHCSLSLWAWQETCLQGLWQHTPLLNMFSQAGKQLNKSLSCP